jgi:hypothetical protein
MQHPIGPVLVGPVLYAQILEEHGWDNVAFRKRQIVSD